MQIEGTTALVTGANRGLGRAFARALLDAGAARVYAGSRDPSAVTDPDVVPVRLDVTDPAQVAAAAERCGDVRIVVNNAGIAASGLPLDASALDAARAGFEVNYYGLLSVSQAFAPVLARNGGGALVNMLSALSWLAYPQVAHYSATKAAAWSLTNALRTQLSAQGTLVQSVHAGYIDTDMTAGIEAPKVTPEQVAEAMVAGLRADAEEVLSDDASRNVKAALANDLELLYPDVRRAFAAAVA